MTEGTGAEAEGCGFTSHLWDVTPTPSSQKGMRLLPGAPEVLTQIQPPCCAEAQDTCKDHVQVFGHHKPPDVRGMELPHCPGRRLIAAAE